MDKKRIIGYFDRAIEIFLCLMVLCLPFSKAAIEVFVWNAFFLWLLKRAWGYRTGGPGHWLPETPLNRVLGFFIAASVLSVLFSVDRGLSLQGLFGKQLKFMAVYFMMVEVIRTRTQLRNLLMAMIASAILLVMVAALQYMEVSDLLLNHRSDRLTSAFSSANGFAGWLILLVPVFACLLGTREKYVSGRTIKIVLAVLVFFMGACILLTYSRGAWLGFCAAVFFIVFFSMKRSRLRPSTACGVFFLCLAALALFLSDTARERIAALSHIRFRSDLTLAQRIVAPKGILIRISLWKESLAMIKDRPVFGHGLNTYARVAPKYKTTRQGGGYSHNSFLQMAAETGVLGLVSFLSVLAAFFRMGWVSFTRKRDLLVLGLLSGILAFLVHGFFDSHLYALQLAVLFWFMMGLTVVVVRMQQDGDMLHVF